MKSKAIQSGLNFDYKLRILGPKEACFGRNKAAYLEIYLFSSGSLSFWLMNSKFEI